MRGEQNPVEKEVRNIIVSLVLLVLAVMVFLSSSPPWTTPGSATVYYSVLSFLCITITVCSRNRIRTDPSPAHSFFSAGTLYASLIFGGAAIFYVYAVSEPVTHLYTSGIFLNLVAFATTGIAMILYSYFQLFPPSEKSIWNSRYITSAYVTVGILAFIIMLILSRIFIEQIFFLSWGYFVGLIALFTYVGATYLIFVSRHNIQDTHDPLRLSISFGLLAIACVVHMSILPAPNAFWIISISLMVISFIYAIVATGYAYLLDLDASRSISYAIATAISVLVVVPFVVTQLVEAFIITSPIEEIGAPIIIHIGGAILAGSLAFVLHTSSKDLKNTCVFPIIAILLYWSVAETVLALSHLIPVYGVPSESRVPYISGSVITIGFLISALRQILKPSELVRDTYSSTKYAYLAMLFIIMNILGEIIQKFLFDNFPTIFTGVFGTSLMLALSYASLALLLDFFLLLASLSGSKISFDSLAVGSLSIWLVIVIMKANFSVWTAGYWAAESVLAISILVFPLLLMYYFTIERDRLTVMEVNATIYSRFLAERIRGHHELAIDTLEMMTKESNIDEKRLEGVSSVLQEISVAEELTRAMSSVLQENRFRTDIMEPLDLVDVIIVAVERLIQRDKSLPQIRINKERGACYVIGNSLLVDTFQKMLEGIIQRIGNIRGLDIDIAQQKEDIRPAWHTTLTIEVVSQDAARVKYLFDRYTTNEWTIVPELAFANRLIRLFYGAIEAESVLGASSQLWLIFKIRLPSTPAV